MKRKRANTVNIIFMNYLLSLAVTTDRLLLFADVQSVITHDKKDGDYTYRQLAREY